MFMLSLYAAATNMPYITHVFIGQQRRSHTEPRGKQG
jgi:hypothetical protein